MSRELFKTIKDKICNAQNRRSDEIVNRVFETYKHSVMSYGKHIFNIVSYTAMATIFAYIP